MSRERRFGSHYRHREKCRSQLIPRAAKAECQCRHSPDDCEVHRKEADGNSNDKSPGEVSSSPASEQAANALQEQKGKADSFPKEDGAVVGNLHSHDWSRSAVKGEGSK